MVKAWLKKLLCRVVVLTEFCHSCGVKQPVIWSVRDELWQTVTGSRNGVLCPTCFDKKAWEHGLMLRWTAKVDG